MLEERERPWHVGAEGSAGTRAEQGYGTGRILTAPSVALGVLRAGGHEQGGRRLAVPARRASLTRPSTCDGRACVSGASRGRVPRRLPSAHLLCLWATLSS